MTPNGDPEDDLDDGDDFGDGGDPRAFNPDFAQSCTYFCDNTSGSEVYEARLIVEGKGADYGVYEVTAEQYRIVDQYEAARRRQSEAQALAERRWRRYDPPPPPPEPEPEAVPTGGKLTGRQEAFCRQYAAQPVATRAAALAGYSEISAATLGSRLLKNPLVLERIAQLRDERSLHYVLERDTLHDKLEAVFFEALGERNHAAAVSALRLQAGLGGLMQRPEPPAPDDPEAAGTPRRTKVEKSRGGRRKKVKKSRVRKARPVEKRR